MVWQQHPNSLGLEYIQAGRVRHGQSNLRECYSGHSAIWGARPCRHCWLLQSLLGLRSPTWWTKRLKSLAVQPWYQNILGLYLLRSENPLIRQFGEVDPGTTVNSSWPHTPSVLRSPTWRTKKLNEVQPWYQTKSFFLLPTTVCYNLSSPSIYNPKKCCRSGLNNFLNIPPYYYLRRPWKLLQAYFGVFTKSIFICQACSMTL